MHPAVPNILSFGRLAGSAALLFTGGLTPPFFIIFILLCLTDLLDGYIARRYDLCTPSGEVLDSLADFSLVLCMFATLAMTISWEPWMMSLIIGVIGFRSLSVIIGSLRFGRLALIHTNLNKFSGLVIRLSPFMLLFLETGVVVVIVCTVCAVASFEELLINSTSRDLDRNRCSYLRGTA